MSAMPQPVGRIETVPVPVIVVFRPRSGLGARVAALVADHAATLRAAGLASDRAPYLMLAADGAIVELFEWRSAVAMATATAMLRDPTVRAGEPAADALREMWSALADACDYVPLATLAEAASPFARFARLEPGIAEDRP